MTWRITGCCVRIISVLLESEVFFVMKSLKKLNSVSGVFAFAALLIMLTAIYLQKKVLLYYISGGVFIVFGLIFVLTAVVFMLRSIAWHIETKRVRYLVRHYIFAIFAVYIALLVFDHITGGISWVNNAMYSPVLALGAIYLSGYRMEFEKKSPAKAAA